MHIQKHHAWTIAVLAVLFNAPAASAEPANPTGVNALPAKVMSAEASPSAVRHTRPARNLDAITYAPAHPDTSIPVRGVVRAIDEAAISTELSASVAKIGFREGQAFKKGDVLVSFNCDRYRAEEQAAEAVAREMRHTLDSNKQLQKFSAVGKHDVEISQARVDKADADARALKARLSQCEIIAPFDGRVADLEIHPYEWPQPGKPFISIVSDDRLEIEIIIPSSWLPRMDVGTQMRFRVDETGRDYKIKVVRLSPSVDAVSQMVRVFAVFEGDPKKLHVLPGMSGTASFSNPNG